MKSVHSITYFFLKNTVNIQAEEWNTMSHWSLIRSSSKDYGSATKGLNYQIFTIINIHQDLVLMASLILHTMIANDWEQLSFNQIVMDCRVQQMWVVTRNGRINWVPCCPSNVHCLCKSLGSQLGNWKSLAMSSIQLL
jgi:hypothetical protein